MTDQANQIIGQYRRHADAFVRKRGMDLFEQPWLDRFLEVAREGSEAPHLLDLGCGFGAPIARYLRRLARQ